MLERVPHVNYVYYHEQRNKTSQGNASGRQKRQHNLKVVSGKLYHIEFAVTWHNHCRNLLAEAPCPTTTVLFKNQNPEQILQAWKILRCATNALEVNKEAVEAWHQAVSDWHRYATDTPTPTKETQRKWDSQANSEFEAVRYVALIAFLPDLVARHIVTYVTMSRNIELVRNTRQKHEISTSAAQTRP